ncbi:DeoR/GlpR family DNA-binding transcription regulator [Marinicrinis lubricantis]|uniref:DeoR/GlpR family DNA-binding transcription regulator n=1 Tax=Marinicrinis lubricantis TaxID=2086470 RepID=A0ABW1IJ74_9BACL
MTERNVSKGERRQAIYQYLKEHGSISLQQLTEQFQCSEATARRDLEALEENGGIIRTLGGGAKYVAKAAMYEVPFREKEQLLLEEKEAIADVAVSFVKEGDVIGLTGGTTTYLIAKALKRKKHVTIVTNAVNIAMELADMDDLQVVLTGGMLRNKNYELSGPLAERTLEVLNIHTLFMGVDGVSAEQGISTHSEFDASIAKLMMSRSERTIAVFDHSKWLRSSLFHIAPLSALHGCISNAVPPADTLSMLQQIGLQVHIAEKQGASFK